MPKIFVWMEWKSDQNYSNYCIQYSFRPFLVFQIKYTSAIKCNKQLLVLIVCTGKQWRSVYDSWHLFYSLLLLLLLLRVFYSFFVQILLSFSFSNNATCISFPISKWNGWCDFFFVVGWCFLVWSDGIGRELKEKKRAWSEWKQVFMLFFFLSFCIAWYTNPVSIVLFLFLLVFQFDMSDCYTREENRPHLNTIDFSYSFPSKICSNKIETKICFFFRLTFLSLFSPSRNNLVMCGSNRMKRRKKLRNWTNRINNNSDLTAYTG